jgi:hypothetical protein
MKPIITGVLASIAALGLLSACGGDDVLTLPTDVTTETGDTLPTDITLPGGISIPDITLPGGITIPDITIPAGASIPSDLSVPQELIDVMIAQFEAAGMKVDKECFTKLLADDGLRKLAEAGGTPSPEVIQKFFTCIQA